MGNKGSALVTALIFITMISMISAAIVQMNLGMFLGATNLVDSSINQAQAESIIHEAFRDIGAPGVGCDQDLDGRGCTPAPPACPTFTSFVSYAREYWTARGEEGSETNAVRTVQVDYCWDGNSYQIRIRPI